MVRSVSRIQHPRRTLSLATGCTMLLAVACGGGKEQRGQETGAAAAPPAATASAGEQAYARCSTCHLPTGEGLPGTYPPLKGSPYANASNVAVPINIVIRGLQGPITVHGQTYNSVMPPYGTGVQMNDDEVAAVLTYVRSSWGNSASPVTAQQVAQVRTEIAGKTAPTTAAELDAMMKQPGPSGGAMGGGAMGGTTTGATGGTTGGTTGGATGGTGGATTPGAYPR